MALQFLAAALRAHSAKHSICGGGIHAMREKQNKDQKGAADADKQAPAQKKPRPAPPEEVGGRDGPEPTRYGDWEKGGRAIDF